MKEKIKYRRYMVFSWCEYDNQKPFEHVDDSFDCLSAARDFIKNNALINMLEEDGTPLYCIFDRVEGAMME